MSVRNPVTAASRIRLAVAAAVAMLMMFVALPAHAATAPGHPQAVRVANPDGQCRRGAVEAA